MAEAGGGMGIDRDLRDLVVGELVGPLHLQRHSARLDLEARGQRGRNEARCDFLVYLGDALPEQVFDQVEDGTAMPLQQPSDRGKLCIDVDLGKANREIAVFGVAKSAHRKPGGADGRPWLARSEEHTSELQSHSDLVCRLLLEKKKKKRRSRVPHDEGSSMALRSRETENPWVSGNA